MGIVGTILLVLMIISAVAVIVLVLLQHGKGADMGVAFGSGSSGSVFGAAGSANFLSRLTAVCAAVFFCSTLGLAYVGGKKPVPQNTTGGVMDAAQGAGSAVGNPAASSQVVPQPSVPATAVPVPKDNK